MKTILLFLGLSLTLLSCKKENVHQELIGMYSGHFLFNNAQQPHSSFIAITEATDDYLIINEGVVYRDGKRVYGKIKDLYFAPDQIEIDGEWKKEGNVNSFSGTFVRTQYNNLGVPIIHNGTFEIVPK